MNEMETYSGFAWAVPRAFGAAVHACRFEQGDVLYSDASAYDENPRVGPPARYHIQVLDPPRTTRALRADGEGQRFFSNWDSPVTFEWMDYHGDRCEERSSTQGGLFTCLWKGDVGALREEVSGDLPRPLLLRDLQARVGDCASSLVARLDELEARGGSKQDRSVAGVMFASAIDQSSDSSRVKDASITRALEAQFSIAVHRFSPGELALAEAGLFHPALEVLGVVVASEDLAQIESVLREVLYAGGKASGTEEGGGRFQLARHGCLVALA